MLIQLETSFSTPFSTRNPSTGVAQFADSLPTATVELNGTPIGGTGISVVQLAATGQYRVNLSVTAANGFSAGSLYTIRVAATVDGVSDEAPITMFQPSVESHGVAIDKSIASVETNIVTVGDANWATATGFATPADVPTVAQIWAHTDTESATKTAFQVICMAAAGAGAGTVDVSVAPGVTRNETTRYLDGSDAYITAADENGNRTLVNLNP